MWKICERMNHGSEKKHLKVKVVLVKAGAYLLKTEMKVTGEQYICRYAGLGVRELYVLQSLSL